MEQTTTWPPARTAWFVALMLMLANTLAFVDRQALALLIEPIKQDLGLSDTAASLLYGLSFTLFYVLAGLPVARLADRWNRRNIIAASVLVWSVATAACGLARSYWELFAARVGVGAGEGGLSPSAYSMLADYFPPARLAAAIGIYQVGLYFGGAAALVIGGLLSVVVPPTESVMAPIVGPLKGWQVVFLCLGAPGMLLALLVLLTVKEPIRMGMEGQEAGVPLSQFFAHVGRRRAAYLGIGLGFALMILVGNGAVAWTPAFLERKFGWTTAQIGQTYGPIVFVCGASGAVAGGLFASFLRRRGVGSANLLAALLGFAALIPITVGFPLAPTVGLTLTLIGAMNFFAGFNFGGGLAALQELTPNRMRALLSAGYMVLINVVGAAGGPTIIALLTDFLFRDPDKLPEAMALTAGVASPLALLSLYVGLRSFPRAVARVA